LAAEWFVESGLSEEFVFVYKSYGAIKVGTLVGMQFDCALMFGVGCGVDGQVGGAKQDSFYWLASDHAGGAQSGFLPFAARFGGGTFGALVFVGLSSITEVHSSTTCMKV